MKYRTSMLSMAMASIVLVAMVAAAGVTAAAPATVGGPASSAPSVGWDGTNYWVTVVGGSLANGNIYWKLATTTGGLAAAPWSTPLGTGSNPCVVGLGAAGAADIFWVQNGQLVGRTTTDSGAHWSAITLLPSTVTAGGPVAVSVGAPSTQVDVFYVGAGGALMWDQLPSNVNNLQVTLGGQVFATPAAAVAGDGSIQLVVRGSANRIYQSSIALGNFNGYSKWHDGLIGAGATLWSSGTGGMLLFVMGTNTNLYVALSLANGYANTWFTIRALTGIGSNSQIWWGNFGGSSPYAPSSPANPAAPLVFVTGGPLNGNIWLGTILAILPPRIVWTVATAGP